MWRGAERGGEGKECNLEGLLCGTEDKGVA